MTRTEKWAAIFETLAAKVRVIEETGGTAIGFDVRFAPDGGDPTIDFTFVPAPTLERIVLSPEASRMYTEFTR